LQVPTKDLGGIFEYEEARMAGSFDSAIMTSNSRLNRTTIVDDVTNVLRQRILAGHYSEEHFIRQELIASELGVSRIPVREALAQLEAEGLVVRVKYRGAIVPKRSFAEIAEIFELRLLIEPNLLRNAIHKLQPAQLQALREIVQASRETMVVAEWAELNVKFHRTLFEAAERPITLQLLDTLLVRADRYLKLQNFHSTKIKDESDAEHSRLLDLVAAGDVDKAVEVLQAHIRWNADDMRNAVSDTTSPPIKRRAGAR
jgi:DNA-binding GntR family transcriptional regulator